jgi:hypothetical protein
MSSRLITICLVAALVSLSPVADVYAHSDEFIRADVDTSELVDLNDAISLLKFLFIGGETPSCMKTGDVNDNGVVDFTDGIELLKHLFLGTVDIPVPAGKCGKDPTQDTLTCEMYEPCDDHQPGCPDPAATDISATVLSRTGPFAGKVLISGTVTNLGAMFDSNPGQQTVYLYEVTLGGTPRLVASQDFVDLTPGATVSVSAEVVWSSILSEFPPSYRVLIGYDPDIFIDGIPNNDDCNTTNNAAEVDGFAINDLLR